LKFRKLLFAIKYFKQYSLGEKVSTLVSEELKAGSYKYDWNAGNLTSGIYFYTITAGSFVETKKMILLK
jgi:hypothetical protein